MAINQNHLFDELDGIKCAIVEKNARADRVRFLRSLLEFNGYRVIAVPSPPPKMATAPLPVAEGAETPVAPVLPETFTVGVTDVMFNPTNAIFGRLLKTPGGQVVTLAFWQQKELESNDQKPYFFLP